MEKTSHPRPRQRDRLLAPLESRANLESLEALASGDKGRMLTLVHEHIRACRERGSTADEGCIALNVGPNSVAPRIYDLIKNGAVVALCDANGKRVRRKTRQGCYARVVVAAEFAPMQRKAVANTDSFPEFNDLTGRSRYPD